MYRRHPTIPGRPANPWPVAPVMFAEDARAIMRFATQEARQLHCQFIAAEHILLGLLKEGSGVTPSMLKSIEGDFSKVRDNLIEKMDCPDDVELQGTIPYTAGAFAVMTHALKEAQDFGSLRIEPSHVLLGLICETDTIASEVLLCFGISADQIRKDISEFDSERDI